MNWNHLAKASVVLVAAACLNAQAASNGITVSIAPEKTRLSPHDDVFVKVTMTNTSSQNQFVLKYFTPFVDEVEEGLFEVTRDGQKVSYEGAHYKRPAPTASDYFLLKPGASHSAKVELSSSYDMSITGDYSIRYKAKSMNLFAADLDRTGVVGTQKQIGEIASAAASLWIDGAYPRGTAKTAPIDPPSPMAGALSFSKCTTTQQATITDAMAAAGTMVGGADAYMQSNATPGERYVKWFGALDAGRQSTVKAHFVSLKDAFGTKPVTVDCGCKKTYYAYVYPNQPYKIYVCKAFWNAPMVGTDSKGGTLVHEMSHFTVVAGTDDWVYGQSGAASLAISNPDHAIDNADSHEYFSENTPALQ
jgi:peptidyl-Lys metalloendopeptidase